MDWSEHLIKSNQILAELLHAFNLEKYNEAKELLDQLEMEVFSMKASAVTNGKV